MSDDPVRLRPGRKLVKKQQQLQADVEQFLQAGGEIEQIEKGVGRGIISFGKEFLRNQSISNKREEARGALFNQ